MDKFTVDAETFRDRADLETLQTSVRETVTENADGTIVDHLVSEAGTTLTHDGGDIEDTLRDAAHELRSAGFGGADHTPDHIEIYADALWVCHTDVRAAIMEPMGPFGDGGVFEFQGYPVLASDGVSRDHILLADPRALTENPVKTIETVGYGNGSFEDLALRAPMPVLVRSPDGLVAVKATDR
jgi:hypothetical protein